MKYYLPITLLLLPLSLLAQRSIGGTPLSFYPEFQAAHSEQVVSPIDIPQPTLKEKPDPRIIAFPIAVDFDLDSDGQWTEMSNGDRLWRLHLQVKGAANLSVLYDDFFLPKGAKFFAYSPDKKQLLGAYTRQNNTKLGSFITGEIAGEAIILEYYEPVAAKGEGRIHIQRVDYARLMNEVGFGSAAGCHINVNCEEGNEYRTDKTSVCRMRMVFEEGQALCTGTLLNNTLLDGTPYLLTAFHCEFELTPMYDLWRFDWHYESETCDNPTEEPRFLSMLGCSKRAAWGDTDFMLLELSHTVPKSYNVFLNGWDRGLGAPNSAAHIHHPRGDTKKISLDGTGGGLHPEAINWNFDGESGVDRTTPDHHHFINIFSENNGTFEQGSSGSALLNEDKRVVGLLTGGFEDTLCQSTTAYFGRLALSWEGGGTPETRLKDWIDPTNSSSQTVDALANPVNTDFVLVQGRITTPEGAGIGSTTIIVVESDQNAVTDIAGNYFMDDLVFGENYIVGPVKDVFPLNGVTTFDLIQIRRHILNTTPFTTPFQLIAGDVNDSDSVTTFDVVQLQKLILNIDTVFSANTSWRFVTEGANLADIPAAEYDYAVPNAIQVSGILSDIQANFIGIKIGDLNGSVDPAN